MKTNSRHVHIELFDESKIAMTKMAIMLLGIALLNSACLAQGSSKQNSTSESSQILRELKREFQKKNPLIGHVDLFDVRPLLLNPINYPEKPNHYLVVARGVRGDLSFHGSMQDELLGLFLFDDSLFAIKRVVAYIPTQRWGDFIVKIVRVWKDSVTVQGVDLERGDLDFVKKFYLLK